MQRWSKILCIWFHVVQQGKLASTSIPHTLWTISRSPRLEKRWDHEKLRWMQNCHWHGRRNAERYRIHAVAEISVSTWQKPWKCNLIEMSLTLPGRGQHQNHAKQSEGGHWLQGRRESWDSKASLLLPQKGHLPFMSVPILKSYPCKSLT